MAITPYAGPALAPQRTATLDSDGTSLGPPGTGPQFVPGQGTGGGLGPTIMSSAEAWDATTAPKSRTEIPPTFQPNELYNQPTPDGMAPTGPAVLAGPQFLASPPPAEPTLASEVQALRQQNGELIQRLGSLETGYRRSLEQMQLRMEAAAIPAGYHLPPVQLPPGIDPDAQVTAKEFFQGVYNMLPALSGEAASQAIRSTWDITSQEEQQVLGEIPEISQKPEPVRTQLIMKAARMNRSYASPVVSNGPTPAPAPQVLRPVREVGRVVPHVESAMSPMAPEPVAQDRNALAMQAQTEYERARQMPRRTAQESRSREEALRAAWRRVEGLTSTPDTGGIPTGFVQRA